jgi:V/A-type H+-transporting ATPase subunit E
MNAPEQNARGVDALIAQLRSDGIAAGTQEAERIVAEAKAEAAKVVAAAKTNADKALNDARLASERYERAGKEALNTAMRDAVLTMKSTLMARFESDVQRMVAKTMADPKMLKQMVLELVGRAREDIGANEGAEVILPAQVVGPDAIRENADDIKSGKLTKFVLGLSQKMLEEGVTLHASDDLQGGIKAKRGKDGILLDMSDGAIASLLMQHLQPRFRAVLEGVVR